MVFLLYLYGGTVKYYLRNAQESTISVDRPNLRPWISGSGQKAGTGDGMLGWFVVKIYL
jgi:hypothetical protein